MKSGYEMFYKSVSHEFHGEIGYNVGGYLSVNGLLGIGFRDHEVQIWKVYANGNRSFGNENDLNGSYTAFNAPIYFGVSAGFRVSSFYFPVKVVFSTPLIDHYLPYSDLSPIQDWRGNDLPLNYADWVLNPKKYDPDNGVTSHGFDGFSIQFGLQYLIPMFNKK